MQESANECAVWKMSTSAFLPQCGRCANTLIREYNHVITISNLTVIVWCFLSIMSFTVEHSATFDSWLSYFHTRTQGNIGIYIRATISFHHTLNKHSHATYTAFQAELKYISHMNLTTVKCINCSRNLNYEHVQYFEIHIFSFLKYVSVIFYSSKHQNFTKMKFRLRNPSRERRDLLYMIHMIKYSGVENS